MVGVNPKTKLNLLTDEAFGGLYHSGKDTLRAMTDEGGRSTEKIFSGARGGTRSCCPVKRINSPAPLRWRDHPGGVSWREYLLPP